MYALLILSLHFIQLKGLFTRRKVYAISVARLDFTPVFTNPTPLRSVERMDETSVQNFLFPKNQCFTV